MSNVPQNRADETNPAKNPLLDVGHGDAALLEVANATIASMRTNSQPRVPSQVDVPPTEPNHASLSAALGDSLRAAHDRHKDDKTVLPNLDAGADYLTRQRATGKVLSFLQHDTPTRRALLAAAGLDPGSISPALCGRLAESLLIALDQEQAVEQTDGPRLRPVAGYDEHPNRTPTEEGLYTRRLSEVEEQDVEWLWPQRVPLGKLTIVSGDPDLGKTFTVLDVIARITTGRDFPDAVNPFQHNRRDALWVSGEDEDGDTIKPRLRLLGADASRVHSLAFVFHTDHATGRGAKAAPPKEQMLDLGRHLEHLDEWLAAHPLVAVVAIDPLAAFLGKTDTHRNSDVRSLLMPMTKLAAKHNVAVIGINHLAKGTGGKAMYRSMGSMAFVAAARSSWLVTADPKEPKDRRLFTKMKANLATEDVGGLAFRVGGHIATGLLWEEGTVATTADEALHVEERDTKAPAKAEAKEWLRELLKDGEVMADDVWSKATADGLCQKTVNVAKKELGVRTRKTGGKGAPWAWTLSDT